MVRINLSWTQTLCFHFYLKIGLTLTSAVVSEVSILSLTHTPAQGLVCVVCMCVYMYVRRCVCGEPEANPGCLSQFSPHSTYFFESLTQPRDPCFARLADRLYWLASEPQGYNCPQPLQPWDYRHACHQAWLFRWVLEMKLKHLTCGAIPGSQDLDFQH